MAHTCETKQLQWYGSVGKVRVCKNCSYCNCPHQDNFMKENAAKVGMEHSVEFYLPRRIFKLWMWGVPSRSSKDRRKAQQSGGPDVLLRVRGLASCKLLRRCRWHDALVLRPTDMGPYRTQMLMEVRKWGKQRQAPGPLVSAFFAGEDHCIFWKVWHPYLGHVNRTWILRFLVYESCMQKLF